MARTQASSARATRRIAQRLAALVPRPRLQLIRFHCVLAPNAKLRALVVPHGSEVQEQATEVAVVGDECEVQTVQARPQRISWAQLLKRVFDIDMQHCRNCGADIDGFSLHAAVRVEAHDRKRLGQLCRYITRPALSDQRVQLNDVGQVELTPKTPWRDGTTHLVMRLLEFMEVLHLPMTASQPSS